MKIQVSELRKRSLMVCTPMYGGQCYGVYTKSCIDLSLMCAQHGIKVKFFYLFNESLITRARNYLVDEFLRSDYTHLMFIDSDIGFDPRDVLGLLAIADPKSDKDIVCGPYAKKTISWERIRAAVHYGIGKENPTELEKFVGDYVFNPVKVNVEIPINQPIEVLESGTGFMMIQRPVFEKFKKAYPEQMYLPDHNRSVHFDGSRQICAYFDTVIDEKTNRYLSEDYMFSQWSRAAGSKVWLCPWMKMQHIGTYAFTGSLPDIARLPNASHGGVTDAPAAKTDTSPPPPTVELTKGNDNPTKVANRAERRRHAALARKKSK